MQPVWWKRSLAEGIGTFGLTFISAGAICANRYSGGELGLSGIALASAAALATMAYATVGISGAHLNPAITVAAAANGAVDRVTAAAYVAAQVAGAALAGFCLSGLYSPEIWGPVQLGAPALSPEVMYSTGAFIEGVLGFLIVFVALQVGENEESAAIVYGLAVGSVLVCGTLAAGSLTGAAMNPARALGPVVASGAWRDQAVYWIGPIAGGLLAALTNRTLRQQELG